jgi:hypothetical protein
MKKEYSITKWKAMIAKFQKSKNFEITFEQLEKKGYTFDHTYNYMNGTDYCLTQVFDANSSWICSFVWREKNELERREDAHLEVQNASHHVIVFDAFNGPLAPDGISGLN